MLMKIVLYSYKTQRNINMKCFYLPSDNQLIFYLELSISYKIRQVNIFSSQIVYYVYFAIFVLVFLVIFTTLYLLLIFCLK